MADWNLPTLDSLYTDVLNLIHGKIVDAATMFKNAATNIPEGAIRAVRDGSILSFEERVGNAWVSRSFSAGAKELYRTADIDNDIGSSWTTILQNIHNDTILTGMVYTSNTPFRGVWGTLFGLIKMSDLPSDPNSFPLVLNGSNQVLVRRSGSSVQAKTVGNPADNLIIYSI